MKKCFSNIHKIVQLIFAVSLTLFLACSSTPLTSTPTTTPPASATTSSPAPNTITIELTAQNISFNLKQIIVPTGAAVTVNFKNNDSGIPHNFSVYQNLSGGQTKPVFVGKTITGPSSTIYSFIAPPAQGSYFFECDVHPTVMNGTFTVTTN
jgi:plastocyanin